LKTKFQNLANSIIIIIIIIFSLLAIETVQNHFTYEFWFFSSPVKEKKAIEYVTKSSALASPSLMLLLCTSSSSCLCIKLQNQFCEAFFFFFWNAILFLSALLAFWVV
jgi:hypothetical protein